MVLGTRANNGCGQPAGTVSVKAGIVVLTLKDLTGFNGRCDAIYFTTEKGQLPPARTTQLTDFRKRCWIFQPNRTILYDVIVTGGGIAGMVCSRNRFQIGMQSGINQRPPSTWRQ